MRYMYIQLTNHQSLLWQLRQVTSVIITECRAFDIFGVIIITNYSTSLACMHSFSDTLAGSVWLLVHIHVIIPPARSPQLYVATKGLYKPVSDSLWTDSHKPPVTSKWWWNKAEIMRTTLFSWFLQLKVKHCEMFREMSKETWQWNGHDLTNIWKLPVMQWTAFTTPGHTVLRRSVMGSHNGDGWHSSICTRPVLSAMHRKPQALKLWQQNGRTEADIEMKKMTNRRRNKPYSERQAEIKECWEMV